MPFRIVGLDDFPPRFRAWFAECVAGTDLVFECQAAGDARGWPDAIHGANAVVSRWSRVDAAVLNAAGPSLQLVQVLGRLPWRVDLDAAQQADVPVATMPSGGAIAVAEQTLALMLAVARKVVPGHIGTVSGAYRARGLAPARTSETVIKFNWLGLGIDELCGKRLGLIGFGEIGQEVARRARAFDMSIGYHQRTRLPPAFEELLGVRWLPLDELLASADYLSLHAPQTPDTEGLIDADRLARMKPTAVLINTARGALVDEHALATALRSGHLAGAGLDVFVEEPLPADHPLASIETVVLAPHVGGGAGGGNRGHIKAAIENIARVARGDAPRRRIRRIEDARL